jgi:oligoendopeptidase F
MGIHSIAIALLLATCASAAAQPPAATDAQAATPANASPPDAHRDVPPAAPRRDDVDERYKWNLAEIYASDDAWDDARRALARDIAGSSSAKRPRLRSAADLFAVLSSHDRIEQRASRLAAYANMRYDLDTRVGRSQQMKEQAREARVALRAAQAWIRPAIIALGEAKVRRFLQSEPRLAPYRHPLEDTLRFAPHTLDAAGEKLLAETGRIAGAGEAVWSVLTNADMPWPTVTLADGRSVLLDESAYEELRESPKREDRILVFRAFWNAYAKYRRTLGSTLNAQIQAHEFRRVARHYGSSLEAALFEDNIPVAVYARLVDDAHRALPTLRRYLELRRRMLGVDRLRYEDIYAPLVGDHARTFTPGDATELVLRAVAPLGPQYRAVLADGLHARWTDWYPATGKMPGAYSTMVYGLHPFQLQNFTGRYAEVSTLAHESGHSMHSYLAAKTQPYATWAYPTFIAEVASTLNENLLVHTMLEEAKDDDERLFLLGNELELLRTTLFRQVLFAEFELRIHESVQKGEPLTGESLDRLYLSLLRTYYGQDEGACDIDPLYAAEWAFVPHFYYDFYVFQYATSILASVALAEGIRDEAAQHAAKTPRRDHYLQMLSAGSSRYAYDMLKDAGVDLATSAPFGAAMREMNDVMDRIESILATRGTLSNAPVAAPVPQGTARP